MGVTRAREKSLGSRAGHIQSKNKGLADEIISPGCTALDANWHSRDPFLSLKKGKKNYSMNIYKAGQETETTQSLRLARKERKVKFFQP